MKNYMCSTINRKLPVLISKTVTITTRFYFAKVDSSPSVHKTFENPDQEQALIFKLLYSEHLQACVYFNLTISSKSLKQFNLDVILLN